MNTRTFQVTYLLNVGMDRNDKGRNTNGALMVALAQQGIDPVQVKYHRSTTERTAVIQLEERPTNKALKGLCKALAQDCVALVALPSAQGALVGPKADKWGPFDPSCFLMPNGRPLFETGQAPPLGGRPGPGHTVDKNRGRKAARKGRK